MGTGVEVIVGVKVSVGVKVFVGVGVMVGVRVGVKVSVGGKVGVRLEIGCAVGTAVIFCAAATDVTPLDKAIVAENGVTAGVGWQAASSKKPIKANFRIIVNSNSNFRGLHHP